MSIRHILDDEKDHWADRRKGLDYMIAQFRRMNLPGSRSLLNDRIESYAAANNIAVAGPEEIRLED